MRVKKIAIQIKSLDEALDEFVDTAVKTKSATYIADKEKKPKSFKDTFNYAV